MSTLRRNRAPAKPRPRPRERYVRWIEKPSAEFDGWGALMLQTDGTATVYLVRRLHAIDFG